MMLSIGLAFLIGAGICATAAMRAQSAEQIDTKLSWFLRPRGEPRQVSLLRAIAAALSVVGSVQLFDVLEWWALLLLCVVWSPSLVLQLRHNRRVQRNDHKQIRAGSSHK